MNKPEQRRRSKFRWLWILLLFLVLSLPIVTGLAVIENQPVVADTRATRVKDAEGARKLAKQVADKLLYGKTGVLSDVILAAGEQDLNGVFAIAHRSFPWLHGLAQISDEAFELKATLHLPSNPVGEFINMSLQIESSDSGPGIRRVTVGHLSLSGEPAHQAMRLLFTVLLGEDGAYFFDSVNMTRVAHGRIIFRVRSMPDLPMRLARIKQRVKGVRDDTALFGDVDSIRGYYKTLQSLVESRRGERKLSLFELASPLFDNAARNQGDPVAENRAAILAMAIPFGNWRVEQMIGDIRSGENPVERYLGSSVKLGGRVDLRQHFLVSAALKIFVDSGFSNGIGEFKELLDAGDGGSGFSFADLAADRAGVRFAEQATGPDTALSFQRYVARNPDESHYLPNIKNLPEGISEQSFNVLFGDVESTAYRTLVQAIDNCVGNLPAYSGLPFQGNVVVSDCKFDSSISDSIHYGIMRSQHRLANK